MKTSPHRATLSTSFTQGSELLFGFVCLFFDSVLLLVLIMLPSPFITSSTTPFSVKDILKLELQQQSQQHQLHLISCLGFSSALSQPEGFETKQLRSHSPPSCMMAGRESASPISSGISESEERMSYLNTLAAQDRLTESDLPVEMLGTPAQNHSAHLRLVTEQEDQDNSKCNIVI